MEFVTLDLKTATEEELLACLEKNAVIAKSYHEEVTRLRALANTKTRASKETKPITVKTSKTIIPTPYPKDEDFEDEVYYYYSAIRNLSDTSLISQLEEFLPSKKHPHYKKIMVRLQAEILREIKDLKELKISLSREGISDQDAEILIREILYAQQKISKIASLLAPRKSHHEELEPEEENRLIFIPTSSGRIRVFDELESMPLEYYGELFDLFSSIKNGTFKSVRRFQGDNFGGISEVRGKMMRVVFDRLDTNSYAILTIFAKKFDNTSGYRTSLETIAQNYLMMEKGVTENLDNEEFLAIHKSYEDELFRRISIAKDASSVKVKEAIHG